MYRARIRRPPRQNPRHRCRRAQWTVTTITHWARIYLSSNYHRNRHRRKHSNRRATVRLQTTPCPRIVIAWNAVQITNRVALVVHRLSVLLPVVGFTAGTPYVVPRKSQRPITVCKHKHNRQHPRYPHHSGSHRRAADRIAAHRVCDHRCEIHKMIT